jgi:hypothetical protein
MEVVFAYARNNKQNIALNLHVELIVRLAGQTVVFDYLCQRGQRVLIGQVLDGLLVVRVHDAPEHTKAVLELGLLAAASTVSKKAIPVSDIISLRKERMNLVTLKLK